MYGFTSRLFSLVEETRRNREDLKELQQSLHQTQKELRELTETMQRFAYEMQRRVDNEVHEREKMELRLQVAALRGGSALISAEKAEMDTIKGLQELTETLKRENEELRQRLEQLEAK